MTISITKRELEALEALYDEVFTNFEAASDSDYIETTNNNLTHARIFLNKCHLQRQVEFVARRIYKRGGHVNKAWIIEQLNKED